MNRAGGEAVKVSDVKGGVSEYAWSPDGKRVVLRRRASPTRAIRKTTTRSAPTRRRPPPPIVIDRYHFKQDVEGYLRNERTHLYLFDVADEEGRGADRRGALRRRIAGLVARRHADRLRQQARHRRSRSQRQHRRLGDRREGRRAAAAGDDVADCRTSGPLSWSPDGKQIAYLAGEELKYSAYNQNRLAVIPAAGGQPRFLAESLDRPIRAAASGGRTARRSRSSSSTIARSTRRAWSPAAGGSGRAAGHGEERRRQPVGRRARRRLSRCSSRPTPSRRKSPRSKSGKLRRLSHQNDEWLSNVLLGTTEEFTATSKDGTEVHGADRQAGRRSGRGRSIRRCCASTAAPTARTSTRSASSASSSPPTATSSSR